MLYKQYINIEPANRTDGDVPGVFGVETCYFRPVQGPRPVEDLTKEEMGTLVYIYHNTQGTRTTIKNICKKFDEIRSRPRESAKEKWIKEHMRYTSITGDEWLKAQEKLLSETWDAAIETGREERENAV